MEKTDRKIEPKYIPVKCPVCNGFTTVSFKKIPCKACNSKGYIEIPVKEKNE